MPMLAPVRGGMLALAFTLVATSAAAATNDDSSAVDEGQSQEPEPKKTIVPNPWLDGPDAPKDDKQSLTSSSAPPRRAGADVEIAVPPPPVPDEVLPRLHGVWSKERTSPRLTTLLETEDIERYAPLSLAQSLDQVVGLALIRNAPQQTLLGARGLGPALLDIRVDGVPLLAPAIFSQRSALAFLSLQDVSRVVVHHGPQLMLGTTRGVGAVVDIETFATPRELGESLPLHGALLGGLGGPDALKTVQVRVETGVGRARVTVSGSVVDTDDINRGRTLGPILASASQGGTLAVRADVAISKGAWVFASWQSARQTRLPFPGRCALTQNGNARDCTRILDVGRDAFIAGGEFETSLLGARVSSSARAHVQRLLDHTDRFGVGRISSEQRRDEVLRGGALGHVNLEWPSLGWLLDGKPSIELGLEARRDKIVSAAFTRSTRGADADVTDGLGREVAAARTRVNGSTLGVEAAIVTARFVAPAMNLVAKVRFAHDSVVAPLTLPDDDRLQSPIDLDLLAASFELSGRFHVVNSFSVFASGHRSVTGPSLEALTLGPPLDGSQQVEPVPTGASTTEYWGAELGGSWAFKWLDLDVMSYVFQASGEMRPAATIAGAQLFHQRARYGTGLEIRGKWRTAVDGLFGEGTLTAPLLDEGNLFEGDRVQIPFLNMTPADGVVGPYGHLALHFAPSTSWFSGFVRTRFVAPHARLGPQERQLPNLCGVEQVPLTGSVIPCVGAPGHIGLDVGGRFAPTKAFAIDAVGENLLDQPFAPRTDPLPWGGLGVRLKLTIMI